MKFTVEPKQSVGSEIVQDEISRQFAMRDFVSPKFKKVKDSITFEVPEKIAAYLQGAIEANVSAFLAGAVDVKEKLGTLTQGGKSMETYGKGKLARQT
jgi:hypothetical protein